METEKMQIRRALAEKIAKQIEDFISEKSKLDMDALKVDADQFTEENDDDYTSQNYQYDLEIEGLPVNLIFESNQEEDCEPALSWSYKIDGYDGCIVREHIDLDDLIQDVQDILILKDGGNFRELSLERLIFQEFFDSGSSVDIRELLSDLLSVGEVDDDDSDFTRSDSDCIIPFSELSEENLIDALDGMKISEQVIIEDTGGYFYRVKYFYTGWEEIYRLIELRDPENNVIINDSEPFDPEEEDVEDASESIIEMIHDWHDEYECQMNDSSYHLKQKEISEKVKETVTSSCNIINNLISDGNLFIIDKLDKIKKELCGLFYTVVKINGGEIEFSDLSSQGRSSGDILVLDGSYQTCFPSKIFNEGDNCFISHPDDSCRDQFKHSNIKDIPLMQLFALCDYFHNESKIFNLSIDFMYWDWDELDKCFSIALKKALCEIFHQHPEWCNNPDIFFNDYDGNVYCGNIFYAECNDDMTPYTNLVGEGCITNIILNDDESFKIVYECDRQSNRELWTDELYQIYFIIKDFFSELEKSK